MGQLISWLTFECILALLPAIVALMVISGKQPLVRVCRDGQLFFYCCALTATAVRDMTVLPRQVKPAWVSILLFFTIAGAVYFGLSIQRAQAARSPRIQPSDKMRTKTSLICALFITILIGYFRMSHGLW